MTVLTFAAIALSVFVFALSGDWQRDQFGTSSGNLLLGFEVAAFVIGWIVVARWKIERRESAAGLGTLALAVGLGFLAWFAHPEQVMSRADDRVDDLDHSIAMLRLEHENGEQDPKISEGFRQLDIERIARRFEHTAALARYRNDRSADFAPLSLGALSVAYLALAIAIFVRLRRRRELPLTTPNA